jgi:predicted nucleotidyltransferase
MAVGDDLKLRRKAHESALEQALEHIVSAPARRDTIERAILFGSYAEGRRDLFTDPDIIVVMDSPLDFVSRTAEMYQYLNCPVDLDLPVYTPDELGRISGRGFIKQALERGTVIYEKPAA